MQVNPPSLRPNKGARLKRTKFQRERDYFDVARLYLKGESMSAISTWIGENRPYTLSTTQIGDDLREINRRWQETYLKDYAQLKAKELARIDELERAYWEAWERSKSKKKIEEMIRTEDIPGSGKSPALGNVRVKGRKREEERDGDAIFLEGIRWCIEERVKILGFSAPQRLHVDWRNEAAKAGVNAGELFDEMVGRFVGQATRLDGSSGGGSVEGSEPED